MESITNEDKNLLSTINTTVTQPLSKKAKKKKKKAKKPKEKKCSGLKELLEQINQEKLEKNKLQQKKEKKNSQEKNKEESKIVSQNESEEKNKEYMIKDYLSIINSSISGTTVATLSHEDTNEFQKLNVDNPNKFEYNGLKPNFVIKNCELSEDEKNEEDQFFKKRKISSPICDYFDGFDKILSETHKGSVDMTNSLNFIKKKDFIYSGSMINNKSYNIYNNIYIDSNYFVNPKEENNFDNKNIIDNYNNNIIIDEKNNNNNDIEFKKIEQEGNNINIYNEDYNYLNFPYSQFMDFYSNMMPENIENSKFNLLNDNLYNNNKHDNTNPIINNNKYNNKKNKKANYKNKKDSTKQKRKGDWLCNFCCNLNFSFRIFCNRCKAPKQ